MRRRKSFSRRKKGKTRRIKSYHVARGGVRL